MAAEAVMGAAVEVLVEKLIAAAGEEIGLMRGLKKEVERLRKSLVTIREFLHDASRRQVEEGSVRSWLQDLEDLAYEADDILDDINYEALRRKVEIRNKMKRKICCEMAQTKEMASWVVKLSTSVARAVSSQSPPRSCTCVWCSWRNL